ncbi:MAG: CDP-alcohol phosphatidyltransferase family protein [Candidatus Hydrogenedentota bacterium]
MATYTWKRKSLAWSVHLLTALGATAGFMALIAISEHDMVLAFKWIAVTLVIDGADGGLARLVKVKDVLPQFDGALLDNIVDYFTYVILPAYFIYEATLVPEGLIVLTAAVITLTSAYQFSQADAKTPDFFFRGFPSYWNVAIFYLWLYPWAPMVNFVILMVLAVLVFIPLKFLYPSRTRFLRPLTWTFSLLWMVSMGVILFFYEQNLDWLRDLSLVYVAYYVLMSLYLNFRPKAARPTRTA